MTISRRAFLASASAFSIMEGLASAAGDKRIFAPNGGQAADFLICRRLYLDICGRIPTPEEVNEYVRLEQSGKYTEGMDEVKAIIESFRSQLNVTGIDRLYDYCEKIYAENPETIQLIPVAATVAE